jgi:putative hydrolase of the HAD superfamily
MAVVLSLPKEDFIKQWSDSFDLRATGTLATCEENIEYVSKKIGLPVENAAIKEAIRIRFKFTRRSLIPRIHSIEILSHLKKENHKTGLISDCSVEVPAVWKGTPFANLIDVPVFSCEVGVKKPDPHIYYMILEKLRVKPQDCLYIGDGSSRELGDALQVGMYPVLIRVPYETAKIVPELAKKIGRGLLSLLLKKL